MGAELPSRTVGAHPDDRSRAGLFKHIEEALFSGYLNCFGGLSVELSGAEWTAWIAEWFFNS